MNDPRRPGGPIRRRWRATVIRRTLIRPIRASTTSSPTTARRTVGRPIPPSSCRRTGSPVAATHPPNRRRPRRNPKSPRWLWIAAAIAVLLVVGLVIALVIVMGSSRSRRSWLPCRRHRSRRPPRRGPTRPPRRAFPPERRLRCRRPPPPHRPLPWCRADAEPDRDRHRRLQRLRRRPRHQHHLRGHRRVMQTEFNVMLPWAKRSR